MLGDPHVNTRGAQDSIKTARQPACSAPACARSTVAMPAPLRAFATPVSGFGTRFSHCRRSQAWMTAPGPAWPNGLHLVTIDAPIVTICSHKPRDALGDATRRGAGHAASPLSRPSGPGNTCDHFTPRARSHRGRSRQHPRRQKPQARARRGGQRYGNLCGWPISPLWRRGLAARTPRWRG